MVSLGRRVEEFHNLRDPLDCPLIVWLNGERIMETMDLDIERHLGAVERAVSSVKRDGQPARAVTLARSYETTVTTAFYNRESAEPA